MFIEELKKTLSQKGPQEWYGALRILLSLVVGHDRYKVGKALADLSNTDQHVKHVCLLREQPRADEEMSGFLKDKRGKICVELEFLRKNVKTSLKRSIQFCTA